MRTKLIVSAAAFGLLASSAFAQSSTVTGAAGGAVTGAVVGGPVGAAVGGVTGAIVGSAIDPPPEKVVTYVQEQPPASHRGCRARPNRRWSRAAGNGGRHTGPRQPDLRLCRREPQTCHRPTEDAQGRSHPRIVPRGTSARGPFIPCESDALWPHSTFPASIVRFEGKALGLTTCRGPLSPSRYDIVAES